MSWDALAGDTLDVRPSPLESRRFGMTISRLVVGWYADEKHARPDLGDALAGLDDDLIIARWPTHMLSLATVAAASGRRTIGADVLVYWEAPPDHVLGRAPAPTHDLAVVAASEVGDPAEVVADVVRDSFARYGSHYRASPELDQEFALAGYAEWALSALSRDPDDVLVLRRQGRSLGVATLHEGREGRDLEVELAGLRREAQGMGWYRYLLSECARIAARRGRDRLVISTQAHNVRVQRAWARSGLVPFAAFTTAHAWLRDSAGCS